MKRVIFLLFLVMMVCPGCATIISGNQQEIHLTSTPLGATVTCGNGNVITTPGTVVLSTKKIHTLVARYPGCEPQQVMLQKKLNNWIFCDILWDFGIITIPIDLISGAACELKPKSVHFSFAAAAAHPARNSSSPPEPQYDADGRKIIGWRVDTSRKGPDGGFLRTPVYEDGQKK